MTCFLHLSHQKSCKVRYFPDYYDITATKVRLVKLHSQSVARILDTPPVRPHFGCCHKEFPAFMLMSCLKLSKEGETGQPSWFK